MEIPPNTGVASRERKRLNRDVLDIKMIGKTNRIRAKHNRLKIKQGGEPKPTKPRERKRLRASYNAYEVRK